MTRPTPLLRTAFPVLRDVQTRWSDNDVYGHLNNSVHYKLFDTVLNDWLIGKELLDPAISPVIALVVETGCNYFAELTYPNTIVAGLRVERLGRTSITYGFALFDRTASAAAQGHLTHVLVDRISRKPRAIPEPWVVALRALRTPEATSFSSIQSNPLTDQDPTNATKVE